LYKKEGCTDPTVENFDRNSEKSDGTVLSLKISLKKFRKMITRFLMTIMIKKFPLMTT
jgi:hypothetical protein